MKTLGRYVELQNLLQSIYGALHKGPVKLKPLTIHYGANYVSLLVFWHFSILLYLLARFCKHVTVV